MSNRSKGGQIEFVKWLGPLLDVLRDLGGSGKPKEVTEKIATKLGLTDSFIEETTKTGVPRFYNQVAWARQYLVWEGLLKDSSHGVWTLSPIGYKTELNYEQANAICRKWNAIKTKAKKQNGKRAVDVDSTTVEKNIESTITSPSLIEILQSITPRGFENISKLLLREHGFDNVEVTGSSHDGGIDGYGTLQLNPFVSIRVLFQCKRYKGTVSRAQVGDFRNAMIGRAEKGIILTTGTFSEDAKREASREGAPPIELIDGEKLVSLFEEKELGVTPKIVYEPDLQFFEPYMTMK